MRIRIILGIILFFVFIVNNNILGQNSYNVRKFCFTAPARWTLNDHDVNSLIITTKDESFVIAFQVVEKGDEGVKGDAILNSLGQSYSFNEKIEFENKIWLDCGLVINYYLITIQSYNSNNKYKFIWAQAYGDEDYTILIYGICDYDKFGYYKSDLDRIIENIDYKKK